ncbi:MAG: PHP domain-containing protein [Thermincolia bacterium]
MIELHCHSRRSDGSFSPEELIVEARQRGVKCLAITDHDTVTYSEELAELAHFSGVELVSGIELSAEHSVTDIKVHILGYFFDGNHPYLQEICRAMVERREKATRAMLDKVIQDGYPIISEDVDQYCDVSTNLYKVHIMHALVEVGYCKTIKDPLYKELFSTEGRAFEPLAYIPVEEAVKAVREAGGVAILAHPGVHGNKPLLNYLLELGIQGIEAFHPGNSKEDTQWCLEMAKKHELVVTGGSDFHGLYGDFPDLLGFRSPGEAYFEKMRLLIR